MKIIKTILLYIGLIPAVIIAIGLAWPAISYLWLIRNDDDFTMLNVFATLGLLGIWIFILLCFAFYYKI